MRQDGTDDDAVLTLAIAAARAKAENYTGTAIISQTWEQTLDEFPDAEIEAAQAAGHVDHVAELRRHHRRHAGDPSGNYALDAATFPGWLLPAYGYEWPETRDQANAVTIRYETGYADAAALPGDMRAWLLLTAAFIYAQREVMVLGGKVAEIPARFVDSPCSTRTEFSRSDHAGCRRSARAHHHPTARRGTHAIGENTGGWVDLATVWASAEPLSGNEYFAAGQQQQTVDVRFRSATGPT